MIRYLSRNAFPLIAEILFLAGTVWLPNSCLTYIHFLFYALILGYFVLRRDFSLEDWRNAAQDGESFWIPVLVTALSLALCFLVAGILNSRFSTEGSSIFRTAITSWLEILLFGITTMLLAPITEELFFRQSLIAGKNTGTLLLTALISLLLFALEHGVTPMGILTAVIWGIPFTAAYLRSGNVYIPMTAHLIVNLLGNGLDLITLINFKLSR